MQQRTLYLSRAKSWPVIQQSCHRCSQLCLASDVSVGYHSLSWYKFPYQRVCFPVQTMHTMQQQSFIRWTEQRLNAKRNIPEHELSHKHLRTLVFPLSRVYQSLILLRKWSKIPYGKAILLKHLPQFEQLSLFLQLRQFKLLRTHTWLKAYSCKPTPCALSTSSSLRVAFLVVLWVLYIQPFALHSWFRIWSLCQATEVSSFVKSIVVLSSSADQLMEDWAMGLSNFDVSQLLEIQSLRSCRLLPWSQPFFYSE